MTNQKSRTDLHGRTALGSDRCTIFRIGYGPHYVDYARNSEGDLVWVEIVKDDKTLFRADGKLGEDRLSIARDMVRARNLEIRARGHE